MEKIKEPAYTDQMTSMIGPYPSMPDGSYRENIVISPNNASVIATNGEQIAKFILTSGGHLDPASFNFRYKVKVTSAIGAVIMGAPVYAFWQALRTYCQNIQPDNITKYNQIAGFLLPNLTMSTADKGGAQALWGYDGTPDTQDALDEKTTTVLNEEFYVGGPLICSLAMAQAPIPLFLTGPIQLELQISTIAQIFSNAVVPTIVEITNLEITYDVIHYPKSYLEAIYKSPVVKIPTYTFENSSTSVGAGDGSIDTNFNLTAASCKSMFLLCEAALAATDPNKQMGAWDPTLATGTVQFFIDSKPYPNRAISTLTNRISPLQYLKEAAKSFYVLQNQFGHSQSMSISKPEYYRGLGVGGAPTKDIPAKTIYGILLDKHASTVGETGGILSGISIGPDQIKISTTGTRAAAYNYSLTIFKDEVIIIEPNTRMLTLLK